MFKSILQLKSNCNKTNYRLYWKILFLLFLSINSKGFCQKETLIDQQFMSNWTVVRFVSFYTSDENSRYALQFINQLKKDTIVEFIDSVQHAPCSPPNSIFFINDSIGFFTESGGCYASYDWLFRTNDRGKTWKHIKSGSRTSGNAEKDRLTNQSFYMFNETKGVIIWELEKGQLVYSTTNDGGITWVQQSFKSDKIKEQQIQHIRFSASGEITLVLSNLFVFETDREESLLLKSTNFGKSFKVLD